jgi:hypothetical protein
MSIHSSSLRTPSASPTREPSPSTPARDRGTAWWWPAFLGLALLALVPQCHQDLSVNSANQPPVADARIIRNGQSVNGQGDGGAALLTFPFKGTPVSVTLDASQSHDPDGTITAYQWLSGTPPPEGGAELPNEAGVLHRSVPPGAPPNWPGTSVSPKVDLGEGIWSFTLWVTDNDGAISAPSTITITVGMVMNPAVQQCADAVVQTEPESCRQCLCMQSAMCQAAVAATACDQTCWNLVNCVAAHCPDFMAMAAKMDYSCLTANCAAYTAGSTGATPVAPCFNACMNECTSGAGDGGTGGTSDGGGMTEGGSMTGGDGSTTGGRDG